MPGFSFWPPWTQPSKRVASKEDAPTHMSTRSSRTFRPFAPRARRFAGAGPGGRPFRPFHGGAKGSQCPEWMVYGNAPFLRSDGHSFPAQGSKEKDGAVTNPWLSAAQARLARDSGAWRHQNSERNGSQNGFETCLGYLSSAARGERHMHRNPAAASHWCEEVFTKPLGARSWCARSLTERLGPWACALARAWLP